MEIELKFLSGSYEGKSLRFSNTPASKEKEHSSVQDREIIHVQSDTPIRIGRNPSSTIALDPVQDSVASSIHAEIRFENNRCLLTDLQSTNGTFANGNRITTYILRPGDRIEIGRGGPTFKFEVVSRDDLQTGVVRTQIVPLEQGTSISQRGGWKLGNTTMFMSQVVAQTVKKTSRKFRLALVIAGIVVLLLTSGLIYQNYLLRSELSAVKRDQQLELLEIEKEFGRELNKSEGRIQELQLRIDRGRTNAETSSVQLHLLQQDLNIERQRREQINVALRATRDSISALDYLTQSTLLALKSYQEIARQYGESIFMVCGIDEQSGEVIPIGTGFVVDENGGILTNAHVASELLLLRKTANGKISGFVVENGHGETKFAVENIIIHPEYRENSNYSPDMAYLKVNTAGFYLKPVKLAAADEFSKIASGYEVAVCGFPGITMDPTSPNATLSRGVIGRIIEEKYIQHDCPTSGGNSGSPIFNRNGAVIGIHFSGRGNITVLVPGETQDSTGTVRQTLVSRRIKEAVGINEGIRADLIEDFLKTIQHPL